MVLREMVVLQRRSLGARSQFASRSTRSNDIGVVVVVIVCTKDARRGRRNGLASSASCAKAVLMVLLLLWWWLIVCSGMVIALRMMVMINTAALQSAVAGLGHATFHVVHTAPHIDRRDFPSKVRGLDAHQRGGLR